MTSRKTSTTCLAGRFNVEAFFFPTFCFSRLSPKRQPRTFSGEGWLPPLWPGQASLRAAAPQPGRGPADSLGKGQLSPTPTRIPTPTPSPGAGASNPQPQPSARLVLIPHPAAFCRSVRGEAGGVQTQTHSSVGFLGRQPFLGTSSSEDIFKDPIQSLPGRNPCHPAYPRCGHAFLRA